MAPLPTPTRRTNWALSHAEKQAARRALALLDGSGLTLDEAVAIAIKGRRAVVRVTVTELADRFLRTRLESCRGATFDWYSRRLAQAQEQFGERSADSITRGELRGWLDGLPTAALRAANARAVRSLWRWGLAQEPALVVEDITTGLATSQPPGTAEPGVLTVPQCSAILAAVYPQHRSALALLLFAGLRPQEVGSRAAGKAPFGWECVNVAERIIRVPADVAKSGRARVLEGLPDAVWAWLMPQPKGDVWAKGICNVIDAAKRAAGLEGKWVPDALRHSFASYAVALTDDPGKVALWLGHEGNPRMLHRHYRGLVSKAEAAKFWALRPK